MEVVCLIWGPMLATQPCSHAFWVLTYLVIFIENVFYYSCFHFFFFLNGVNIFIKICSSMKVSLCIYQLFMQSVSLTDDVYSLFHLQHCLQS